MRIAPLAGSRRRFHAAALFAVGLPLDRDALAQSAAPPAPTPVPTVLPEFEVTGANQWGGVNAQGNGRVRRDPPLEYTLSLTREI